MLLVLLSCTALHPEAATQSDAQIVTTHGSTQPVQALASSDLIISYLNRPPYYHTQDGQPRGLLIERVQRILEQAGLSASFREMPAGRILHNVEHNLEKQCSIGWFKNPERQRFARFSLPIWKDSPWMVLTTSGLASKIGRHKRFADLFADQELTWITISGFSYGTVIDQLRQDLNPITIDISSSQIVLPQLIQRGRASYMVLCQEEFAPLLASANLEESDFALLTMSDAPDGNQRYLMCSHAVPAETVETLNRAIFTLGFYKIPGSPTQPP